jgi:hypothetical protein
MTTRLIPALAAALLRPETIVLIVDPALADLRIECVEGAWRTQVRAHVAAWWALWLACGYEFCTEPRGPAWGAGLRTIMNVISLLVVYHVSIVAILLGFGHQGDAASPPFLMQPWNHGFASVLLVAGFIAATSWAAWRAHVVKER